MNYIQTWFDVTNCFVICTCVCYCDTFMPQHFPFLNFKFRQRFRDCCNFVGTPSSFSGQLLNRIFGCGGFAGGLFSYATRSSQWGKSPFNTRFLSILLIRNVVAKKDNRQSYLDLSDEHEIWAKSHSPPPNMCNCRKNDLIGIHLLGNLVVLSPLLLTLKL